MILKKVKDVLLFVVAIFYSLFCFLTLPKCCDESNTNYSTSQRLDVSMINSIKSLEEKYEAEYCDYSSKIKIGSKIVMDTNIVSVKYKNGSYFIKAIVNCFDNKNVFAEMSCSKVIAEKFQLTKTNKLLLVGEISTIEQESLISEADSLSGEIFPINNGLSLLISGTCLELKPSIN
ncbi:MAG: hypothetical protein HXX18_15225 [Bacteroidetes bacterium]|nr:hypothetical protein [Bacteroidota bacterium]